MAELISTFIEHPRFRATALTRACSSDGRTTVVCGFRFGSSATPLPLPDLILTNRIFWSFDP